MASQTQAPQEGRQEGSRWIDRKPEAEELARWFAENVRIHPELSHAHYFPGITLIPNHEWGPEIQADGSKVKHTVYTPYPKVDTRIAYFWDWCEVNDYLGEIEQQPARPHDKLPEGFFSMPVVDGVGKPVSFVGTSYKVHIWRPDLRAGGKGKPVRIPAKGTKIVPMLRKTFNGTLVPDENAIAKAETGAQGRALGFAGMLVVPGAGVATAEDMQDYLSGQTPIAPPGAPEAQGEAVQAAGSLEDAVGELKSRLETEFPQAYEEAVAWCEEKGYSLADPPTAALRGLERQLRRKLEQAEKPA